MRVPRIAWIIAIACTALTITAFEGYRLFTLQIPEVEVLSYAYPVLNHEPESAYSVKLTEIRPSNWVGLDQISRSAIGAVVVSEDWAFFQHEGIDLSQIQDAIGDSIRKGSLSRGASTITQQVVKNIFLTRERTIWRKVKEIFIARKLEDVVTKERILEIYFNIAEWGDSIFGIASAAEKYFDKTPAELSPKEGAFLAMLLPSPKRYSQSYRDGKLSHYAKKTVESILVKMRQAGYISNETYVAQESAQLSFEKSEPSEIVEDAGPLDSLVPSVKFPGFFKEKFF